MSEGGPQKNEGTHHSGKRPLAPSDEQTSRSQLRTRSTIPTRLAVVASGIRDRAEVVVGETGGEVNPWVGTVEARPRMKASMRARKPERR